MNESVCWIDIIYTLIMSENNQEYKSLYPLWYRKTLNQGNSVMNYQSNNYLLINNYNFVSIAELRVNSSTINGSYE